MVQIFFSAVALLLLSLSSEHALIAQLDGNPFDLESMSSSSTSSSSTTSSSSFSSTQSSQLPTFYRSGEKINVRETPKEPVETEVKEEEPEQTYESTISPDDLASPDEPVASAEETVEETQPSAPTPSTFSAIMGQMKLIIGLIGALVAGVMYFVLWRKKPAPADTQQA